MLKCKVKNGKYAKVKAGGTAHDVSVEILAVIKTAYAEIHKQNPKTADEFRRTLAAGILDPKSPVFKLSPLEELTK